MSLTPLSVPPEAQQHVAVLVADVLLSGTPGLKDMDMFPGFNKLRQAAEDFIEDCRKGLNVAAPLDPDPANTPNTVQWGDQYGTKQEVAQGYSVDSLGEQVPIVNDEMNTW